MHFAHRIGVSDIVRSAILSLSRVTKLQRINQGCFARRRLVSQGDRFLNPFEGLRLTVRRHRGIDVGTERQSFAPVCDRQIWIEPFGFAVSAAGLSVIERVRQIQSLIHEELRLRVLRRNRKLVTAELL